MVLGGFEALLVLTQPEEGNPQTAINRSGTALHALQQRFEPDRVVFVAASKTDHGSIRCEGLSPRFAERLRAVTDMPVIAVPSDRKPSRTQVALPARANVETIWRKNRSLMLTTLQPDFGREFAAEPGRRTR